MSEKQMTDADPRKEWCSPQLTVLVRSNPEEYVLSSCKDAPMGEGEATADRGCKKVYCDECQVITAS
jgi:hypothetical protein